uniref:CAP domain-containing protein n=1 Tax=Streptomyces niveiscabiei TaxID=164115 RepID=UPI000A934009
AVLAGGLEVPRQAARQHRIAVDLDAVPQRAHRVHVLLALPAGAGAVRFGASAAPFVAVAGADGTDLATFTLTGLDAESAVVAVELYRRQGAWKVRALGQGYADGLAGLARDFGVDVSDDGAADHTQAVTGTGTADATGTAGGSTERRGLTDPDGFLALVNPARARAGSPPVVLDARLVSAARAHAAAMAGAGKLGVEGRDGVSVFQRVTAAGFTYLAVGEHLVSGPRTHAEFVEYCLSGGDTRRTVQDPAFTHAGVARVDAYWTAVWASPLTPAGLDRVEAEVLELTNRERVRAGLGPLAPDGPLARAARAYCVDMAARAFYSHTSPEGTQPWDRAKAAGSAKRSIGENIACGQRSAAEVVEGWMNSPGHRANILKADFTHLGVGFAGGGPAGTYWTQLFGA